MKITWVRGDLGRHKIIQADTFAKQMKNSSPSSSFTWFRESLPSLTPDSCPPYLEKVPGVIFASGYRNGVWHHYNGLVLLEYKLDSYEEAFRLRNQIILYHQPFLVFVGSSGFSVKVVVKYCLPDGTLPSTEQEAALFHEYAYRRAVIHYQAQFHYPVRIKEPLLNRFCRFSYDRNACYNPGSVPVRIEQPRGHLPEKGLLLKMNKVQDPLQHVLPGMESYEKINLLFENCLGRVLMEKGNTWKREDEKSFLTVMSRYCFDSAIPEEDTVRWLSFQHQVKSNLQVVRLTVRNVYAVGKGFGSKPAVPVCMNILARTEEFLFRRYEFRRNEIRNEVVYREKNSFNFRFQPVTQEVLNDICLNARQEGIDVWDKDIKRYVYSLRVEPFHPVNHFFRNLPEWDKIDRIRALADKVPTADPEWSNRFYKWFVAMTAQLISPKPYFANNLDPVLVGGQGKFKSVFYRQILPPALHEYYTESFNLENKTDAEYQMAQNILIVIDEFDRLNKKYQAELKHLIQKPQVKIRRPHQKSHQQFPRLASFAATSNQMDILTDPSGSRRYICIEITDAIDIAGPVNYEQLYAQAVHAVTNGERYWLTEEEEQEMQEKNAGFQLLPIEVQYLFTYFRKPEEGEKGKKYTAMELLDKISLRSRRKFSNTSSQTFGRMLKASGFETIHTKTGNYYYLIEKERKEEE